MRLPHMVQDTEPGHITTVIHYFGQRKICSELSLQSGDILSVQTAVLPR